MTQIFVAIIAGKFHSFSQKQFFEKTYIVFSSYSHSTVIWQDQAKGVTGEDANCLSISVR